MNKILIILATLCINAVAHAQVEAESTEQTWAEEYADRQEVMEIHLEGQELNADDVSPPPLEDVLINEQIEALVLDAK